MSKIYQNNIGKKFLFFTNYKVMNSNLAKIIYDNFPEVSVFTSNDKIEGIGDYKKIAIVRNPYDRLFSLFTDKCKAHPKKVRERNHNVFLQKSQYQILNTYVKLIGTDVKIVESGKEIKLGSGDYKRFLENLELLETISFQMFLKITARLFKTPDMDAHFIPQSNIMIRNQTMLLDKVFKLENIANDWGEICQLIGKKIVLTEGINRTNFEGSDKYKKYYTTEMKKDMYKLYKMDFEYFNYDK